MSLETSTLVVGLTGPFGSGCSTVANVLSHLEPAFTIAKLSDEVRAAWTAKDKPTRHDLQELGDRLRIEHDSGYLAREAIRHLEEDAVPHERVVVDGIRNTGEIKVLRDRFGDQFFLFAVFAPADVRWERVRDDYVRLGLDEQNFLADDRRDANEETSHGQQVELCVDQSDVFLRNSVNLSALQLGTTLRDKVTEYVNLLTRIEPRYPTLDEVLMNVAFSAAHSTRCLKRQVGAVIATERGEPISVGYNENPDKILPCVEEFGECYRDRIRNEHFFQLSESKTVCPSCGEKIEHTVGPPWRCAKCRANLERYFFPDRAMKWCTALHAEERAIINAQGRPLEGSVIYTTAFPCFLCAEKILQAGITRIVFADPYPDIYSAELLEHSDPPVEVERFEGVRSGSFDRIFGRIRELKEAEVDAKRKEALDTTSGTGAA